MIKAFNRNCVATFLIILCEDWAYNEKLMQSNGHDYLTQSNSFSF